MPESSGEPTERWVPPFVLKLAPSWMPDELKPWYWGAAKAWSNIEQAGEAGSHPRVTPGQEHIGGLVETLWGPAHQAAEESKEAAIGAALALRGRSAQAPAFAPAYPDVAAVTKVVRGLPGWAWAQLGQVSPGLTGAGAALLQTMQEPATYSKEAEAREWLRNTPGMEGLTPEELFTLGRVGMSFARSGAIPWYAMSTGDPMRALARDLFTGVARKVNPALGPKLERDKGERGPQDAVTRWLEAKIQGTPTAPLPRDNELAQALASLRAGESADSVVNRYYNPMAEIPAEMIVDPLNVIGAGPRVTARAEKVAARLLGELPDAKGAARVADLSERITSVGEDIAHAAAQGIRDATGRPPHPSTMRHIVESAIHIADPTPEARASKVAQEVWIALAPVVGETRSPGEALSALHAWRDRPAELAQALGPLVQSEAGQKATLILKAIGDKLDTVTSLNTRALEVGESAFERATQAAGAVEGAAEAAPRWNPARFMLDLDGLIADELAKAYRVPTGRRDALGRLLNAQKRLMSEIYLQPFISPSYWLKQQGEVVGMMVEGLPPVGNQAQRLEDQARLGLSTGRVHKQGVGVASSLTGVPEQVVEGGARAGQVESQVVGYLPFRRARQKGMELVRRARPRVPGTEVEILAGEEARYDHAVMEAWKRWHAQNGLRSLPAPSEDMARLLGPEVADVLRRVAANGWTLKEKRDALEAALNARRVGEAVPVASYIDPQVLAGVSPSFVRLIEDNLRALPENATLADAEAVIRRTHRQVADWTNDYLARLLERHPAEDAAMPRVAAAAEEAELVDDAVGDIRDAGRMAGTPEAAQEAERLAEQVAAGSADVVTAARELHEAAMSSQSPDTLWVIVDASRETETMRNSTRAAAEQAWQRARQEYQALRSQNLPRDHVWTQYFRWRAQHETAAAEARAQRMRLAARQIEEVRSGRPVGEVLGRTPGQLSEQLVRMADELPDLERPAGYVPLSVANPEEAQLFDETVRSQQRRLDRAAARAWQATTQVPADFHGRVTDLLNATAQDVERFGREAAGKRDRVLRRAFAEAERVRGTPHAVDLVWEEYYGLRNDIWNEFFDRAAARWERMELDARLHDFGAAQAVNPASTAVGVELLGDQARALLQAKPNVADWTEEEWELMRRWNAAVRGGIPEVRAAAENDLVRVTRARMRWELTQLGQPAQAADDDIRLLDKRAQVFAHQMRNTPKPDGTPWTELDYWDWAYESVHRARYADALAEQRRGEMVAQLAQRRRWYYSQLQRTIEQKMPNRASPQQIAGIVKGSPVKADELEWTGFNEWLGEQTGPVSKEDVLAYLAENQVEVREVVLPRKPNYTLAFTEDEGRGKWWVQVDGRNTDIAIAVQPDGRYRVELEGNRQYLTTTKDDAFHYAEQLAGHQYADRSYGTDAHYSTYTLPGGENYRELVLTWPGARADELVRLEEERAIIERLKDSFRARTRSLPRAHDDPALDLPPEMRDEWNALLARQKPVDERLRALRQQAAPYTSTHWPGIENPLAHVRFNERIDADGKRVLFIEEVQSDWHQTGREKGYKTRASKDTAGWTVHDLRGSFGYGTRDVEVRDASGQTVVNLFWYRGSDAEAIQVAARGTAKSSGAVPPAPFAKTWPDLVLKRTLDWAAENGFDRVAWTTGAQQAKRYSQADFVDTLSYEAGSEMLSGWKNRRRVVNTHVAPDRLPEFIGRESAARLLAAEPTALNPTLRTISGPDLQIGGHGMTTFYDQMLPQAAERITKKWGGKVGETVIDTSPHGLDVRQHVLGYNVLDYDRNIVFTGTEAEARAYAASHGNMPTTVHSLDITPQMREAILGEGFPLYQKGAPGGLQELQRGTGRAGQIRTPTEFRARLKTVFNLSDRDAANASLAIEQRAHHLGMTSEEFLAAFPVELVAGGTPAANALYAGARSLFGKVLPDASEFVKGPMTPDHARAYKAWLTRVSDPALLGEDADNYFVRLAQEARTFMDTVSNEDRATGLRRTLRRNPKTLLAIDVSSNCPMRVGGKDRMLRPCIYCYVEEPRSRRDIARAIGAGDAGRVSKVYDTSIYEHDILGMPDELVRFINEQLGGLRVFSNGDYTAEQHAILKMVVDDAAQRGLKLKMITKQPEAVRLFGEYPHVQIDITVDFIGDNARDILRVAELTLDQMLEASRAGRLSAGAEAARYYQPEVLFGPEWAERYGPSIQAQGMSVEEWKRRFGELLRPWTPEQIRRGQGALPRLRQFLRDPAASRVLVSNAPTIDQALALKAAAPYGQNIAIRYTAMNARDFIRAVMDPRIDVVTMYHGMTNPQGMLRLWMVQNPGLVAELNKVEPGSIEALASVFTANKPWKLAGVQTPTSVSQSLIDEIFGPNSGIGPEDIMEAAQRKACCLSGVCSNCGLCCGFNRKPQDAIQVLWRWLNGEPRASIELAEDGGAIIRAFSKAKAEDALHELGHLFRRTLSEDEMRTAAALVGADPTVGAWTVQQEEAFADGFMRYRKNAGSVSPETATIFEKLRAWLASLYDQIRGRTKVSPGLREFFDEMLGVEQGATSSGGGVLRQAADADVIRGSIQFSEDGKSILRFFESADLTTPPHEFGHAWLNELYRIADMTQDPAVLDDLHAAETWLGLSPDEYGRLARLFWNPATRDAPENAADMARFKAAQDKFADATLVYLKSGQAPSADLYGLFQRFRSWLIEMWHRLVESTPGIKLSPEMKGVMDRLLALEPFPAEDVAKAPTGKTVWGWTTKGRKGNRVNLEYKVVPLDLPITDRLVTGDPNPRFPEALRRPGISPQEAAATEDNIASGLNADRVAFPTEALDTGAPVIGPDGVVESGNRRVAALRRARDLYPDRYANYVTYLADHAQQYGLTPEQVRALPDPVLVRMRIKDIAERSDFVKTANLPQRGAGAALPPGVLAQLGKDDLELLRKAIPLRKEPELINLTRREAREQGYPVILGKIRPLGYYEPATHRMVVLSPREEVRGLELRTAVHERLHALYDYELKRRDPRWEDLMERVMLQLLQRDSPLPSLLGYSDSELFVRSIEDALTDQRYLKEHVPNSLPAQELGEVLLRNLNGAGVIDETILRSMPINALEVEKAASARALELRPGRKPSIIDSLYQRGKLDAGERLAQLGWLEQAGAGPPPQLDELVRASEELHARGLEQVLEGIRRDWNHLGPARANQAASRAVWQWFQQAVIPSFLAHKGAGLQYARSVADGLMLDYSQMRGFDTLLSYLAPYNYWYTRAGVNWAKRLARRPGILSNWLRVRDAMKLANQNAGRRQRFGESFRIPFPWLPEWMGGGLYVDPSMMLLPFANLYGVNWDDSEEASTGLRRLWQTGRALGIRPYPSWELPYQLKAFERLAASTGMTAQEAEASAGSPRPGEVGYYLPWTGQLKAATALAREMIPSLGKWIPPGGIVGPEAGSRAFVGLPRGDVWDPYRVNRMLANIAAETPQDRAAAIAALDAQELMARDKDQWGRVWEPASEIAQATARELKWSSGRLARAQEMLATAINRAAVESGVRTLGRTIGLGLSIEPAGEKRQIELQRQAQGMMWSPTQPGGSYAAYRAFKEQYPAIYPRITQYQVVPGEESLGMTAGTRANWMMAQQEKRQINATYDAQIDELLRVRPWDAEGMGDLDAQRYAALEAVDARYPTPGMVPSETAVYEGMSPDEQGDAIAEAEIRKWSADKPNAETFVPPGKWQPDWDRYYAAMDAWRASLPETTPALRGIKTGKYVGMNLLQAVEAMGQRYDSPTDALAKVYEELVTRPTLDMREEWVNATHVNAQGKSVHYSYDTADKNTINKVRAYRAEELIPYILDRYRTSGWTEESLRQALQGIVFPPMREWYDIQRKEKKEKEGGSLLPSGRMGTWAPPSLRA